MATSISPTITCLNLNAPPLSRNPPTASSPRS
jgi:hypothetical protein